MNDQPVERTRHISITRTGADGMVSQTEVLCVGPGGRAYRYGGRLF